MRIAGRRRPLLTLAPRRGPSPVPVTNGIQRRVSEMYTLSRHAGFWVAAAVAALALWTRGAPTVTYPLKAAAEAKANCPVSQALAGTTITLTASLG